MIYFAFESYPKMRVSILIIIVDLGRASQAMYQFRNLGIIEVDTYLFQGKIQAFQSGYNTAPETFCEDRVLPKFLSTRRIK